MTVRSDAPAERRQRDEDLTATASVGVTGAAARAGDARPGDEARTDLSTREAPVKWVVVVDEALPPGRAVNAAACIAAAVGKERPDLLATGGEDASGNLHPGLPWAGCSILAADAATLHALREKAAARPDVFVVDMPAPAQSVRVYDEYLGILADTDHADLTYHAVSLVGPRNRVGKLVGRLPLLR